MTLFRRARAFAPAAATLLFLATMLAVLDVARAPSQRVLREPSGFALAPGGNEVSRLAPVTVTFPAAPAERAGPKLLRLEPAADGTYAWLSSRTLLFQPEYPGLSRGGTYTVHVPAVPEAGLAQPVLRTFTVAGELRVQQVIPADGNVEVPLAAPVIVQFSRSVAPLTTLAAQRRDAVVSFDPPIAGKGEWLNTSIYRFTPDALLPATTYRARIAQGVSAAADGVLASDFDWSFTTISPAVSFMSPEDNTHWASPTQQVGVRFNQPMERSAAAGITLLDAAGSRVAGSVDWHDGDARAVFTPAAPLTPAARYVATVAAGLRGARGGETAAARTAAFTVAPPPAIVRTTPADGEREAGRFGVQIEFATPMDPATLEGKLSVGGFTAAELAGRVNVSERLVGAQLSLRPRTTYTVELAPGATDRHGQAMGGHRFSFTTGAVPSSVSLAIPGHGGAATFSSSAEPVLLFQATNLPAIELALYALTPDEGRQVMHDPSRRGHVPASAPLRTWTQPVAGPRDEVVLGSTSLTGGGPLRKGYYYVQTNGAFRSHLAFAVVDTVLVSKLAKDELLVWALDHDSGRPLAGAPVRVSGPGVQPEQRAADAQGLAAFTVPPITEGRGFDRSYVVWIDGGGRHGVLSTRWQQGISPYQFGLPSEHFAREWVGHLYSDRPIYRPGEAVELKAVVRADDDAAYAVPRADAKFQLLVRDPRGRQVLAHDAALSEFGSFAARFAIPADAPVGTYSMAVQAPGGAHPLHVAGGSFIVAEFRAPEFEVEVLTPRRSYVSGDSIDVSAAARFFFGGAVPGASVQWSVLAAPETIRPKGLERYSFGDGDVARGAVYRDPIRARGTATTAADGSARWSVPAVLQPAEGAQRLTLSATVLDENGQAVASSTAVSVHPAALYAGVRPAQYVASAGRDARIDVVSVDTAGARVGGRAVSVAIHEREWITVKEQVGGGRRYRSEPKDTLVATLVAVTDGDGNASVTFRPRSAGTLRVVAQIADDAGRVARAATYLWVSGPGSAAWQVTNDDTIKLVPDKDAYEVGEVADVLVPAPFAGATALVTVERGKLITRSVVTLATNSERLRIPVTDGAVPDIFVSVVLYRAPTAADPVPRFKVGYAQLLVSTATRRLDVQVTPDTAQARPGDTVRYAIRVRDHAGKGVRAELSVAVVDRAVLSLAEERGPDGLRAFWFERGLAVMTGSSMTVSADRWNDAVIEAARAGKGGSGSGGQRADDARKDFRNTAYWSAQLVTDNDGVAFAEVTLPDNLTTWRTQVRAISGDTQVGEGTNELVSTQPLLIRPALPRVLRVGDEAQLRVIVRNATSEASLVRVSLDPQGLSVGGELARSVSIGAGASVMLAWPAQARDDGVATLTFSAVGTGGLADRLVQRVPVLLDVTPETTATGGIVTDEAAVEAVFLPPFARTTRGSLNVEIRSALAGTLADELGWLGERAHEGAERVASRLIASLAVRRAERSGGRGASVGDATIARDIAGLVGRQRGDGGWAWCDHPQCTTDPSVTGWALLALGEARRDGIRVDDAVVARASSYVSGYVGRVMDVAAPADPSQKAFLLAALASAGDTSAAGPARALFEQQRARLTTWGRAYLILALRDAGAAAGDAMVRALEDDLSSATIASANGNHWEDPPVRGSFITNTAATALGVLALARTRPTHALLPQTIRWLVVARAAERWHTSIERALALLAITTFSVATGELGGEFAYEVRLDERRVLDGAVAKADVREARREVPLTSLVPGRVSLLAFLREGARPGRLYYTVDLRYFTPASQVEALNRGFAVTHEYTALDDPSRPVTSVKLGDVIRVKVTVLAPADRKYVVVEDPLPAGLEPIDAPLRTTDPALRAKLEADRASAAERQRGDHVAPWYRWYYSPWQQVELRDDRAVLYAELLRKGVHEHVYYARATTPGDFFVAPARAEETYFPEVFGRSDSSRLVVLP